MIDMRCCSLAHVNDRVIGLIFYSRPTVTDNDWTSSDYKVTAVRPNGVILRKAGIEYYFHA